MIYKKIGFKEDEIRLKNNEIIKVFFVQFLDQNWKATCRALYTQNDFLQKHDSIKMCFFFRKGENYNAFYAILCTS